MYVVYEILRKTLISAEIIKSRTYIPLQTELKAVDFEKNISAINRSMGE